jgi:signal recognition particle GTPase
MGGREEYAEQSVIIEAIQSEKNNRHDREIITDSLSTIMAAKNHTLTKNLKTQTIRKIMKDRELPSYPSHVGILGNGKSTRQQKKRWTSISQSLRDTHQTTCRNG